MNPALRPCEERPDVWPFMVGGIVPNYMNEALVGIASFNLSEKLRGADPIDDDWLDKGASKVLGLRAP